MKNKKYIILLMSIFLLTACANSKTEVMNNQSVSSNDKIAETSTITVDTIEEVIFDKEDIYKEWKNESYTSITLNNDDVLVNGDGASFNNNIVSITSAGTYVVSGTLENGQILINTTDTESVRLILNGVNITTSDNASIYAKQAEKLIISLENDTENTLSDGKNYTVQNDDSPNATIYSKNNLSINGNGSLIINGNFNNAIYTKDDLKIASGNITINSKDDGIVGHDSVSIQSGTFKIKTGGDGIRSTNEDTDKGFIEIKNGTFDIESVNDGIQAKSTLMIKDGSFNITSGGGSGNAVFKTESFQIPMKNTQTQNTDSKSNEETTSNEEITSTKGIKAGNNIIISDGSFKIDSYDDTIHSNNIVQIINGELQLSSGDDGIHSDNALLIEGGDIQINKSYEGLESKIITIKNGTINIQSEDDGINVNQEREGTLNVLGGSIYIDSNGDGLDSNGSIYMSGGTVIVKGPTQTMNGSLDYSNNFDISGGYLISYGSSSMLQSTSDTSTQNSVLMTFSEILDANTIIHIEDSNKNNIVNFKTQEKFQSILFSSSDFKDGETYSLYIDGNIVGESVNGLYNNEQYTEGKKITDFTITKRVTWLDENGETEAKSESMGMGERGGQGGTPNQDGNFDNKPQMFNENNNMNIKNKKSE